MELSSHSKLSLICSLSKQKLIPQFCSYSLRRVSLSPPARERCSSVMLLLFLRHFYSRSL